MGEIIEGILEICDFPDETISLSYNIQFIQLFIHLLIFLGSNWNTLKLSTSLVKNLPGIQETPVQFLGQKDPLEKG